MPISAAISVCWIAPRRSRAWPRSPQPSSARQATGNHNAQEPLCACRNTRTRATSCDTSGALNDQPAAAIPIAVRRLTVQSNTFLPYRRGPNQPVSTATLVRRAAKVKTLFVQGKNALRYGKVGFVPGQGGVSDAFGITPGRIVSIWPVISLLTTGGHTSADPGIPETLAQEPCASCVVVPARQALCTIGPDRGC